MKEEVAEEKRQFLLQLEEERVHLIEERVTLNSEHSAGGKEIVQGKEHRQG